MSEQKSIGEDEYHCPWCNGEIDLAKTRIDIILRKFDINEALIKCNDLNNKLQTQNELLLKFAEEATFRISLFDFPFGLLNEVNKLKLSETYKQVTKLIEEKG